jgi:hypothetical protein
MSGAGGGGVVGTFTVQLPEVDFPIAEEPPLHTQELLPSYTPPAVSVYGSEGEGGDCRGTLGVQLP